MHGVTEVDDHESQSAEDSPIFVGNTPDTETCDTASGLAIWLASAATTIVTTKYLIVQANLTYPCHILLLHLIAALSWRAFRWLRQPTASRNHPTWIRLQDVCHSSWIVFISTTITTICLAGALICSYQALLHLSSLSTVVMILAVDWRPEDFLQGCHGSILQGLNLPWFLRSIIFAVGVTLIFLLDYRLDLNGIPLSLSAAGFAGVLKLIHSWAAETYRSTPSRKHSVELSTIILILTLVPIILLIWVKENPSYCAFNPSRAPVVFVINICAGAVMIDNGAYPFRRIIGSCKLRKRQHDVVVNRSRVVDNCVSLALAGIVLAGNGVLDSSHRSAPLWQYVAFVVASTTFLDCKDIRQGLGIYKTQPDNRSITTDLKAKALALMQSVSSTTIEIHSERISNPGRFASMTIAILAFSSWTLLSITSLYPVARIPVPSSRPHLDTMYTAPRALDIVIARYSEPADHIASTLNRLLRLPNIAPLQPRVIIYDKSNSTAAVDSSFTTAIEQWLSVPADIQLKTRPNIGREGETYLAHVLEQWDALATHTLFLQADVHGGPFLAKRMEDYFLPSTDTTSSHQPTTGFLSLSTVGEWCASCSTTCRDRAGWSEDSTILQEIYSTFNHGLDCANLVRTYKGQFVVSAARIRGNAKESYEGLWEDLVRPDSDKHQPAYWRKPRHHDPVDSLNQPVFGFTLERMWGVIMQCSEVRVARECPSLESGLLGRHGGSVEDCQCLDRVD